MTPAFRIDVNGQDVTARLADRLLSLTVTDEDGDRADRVEIELDDRGARIALPDMDASLTVALGYRGRPLALMGIYAVDGLSGGMPPQTLSIRATAADLKGQIRAPRTRAWEGKTLAQIVEVLAAEAGLKAVVGASVAQTRWAYLAQTAESNLAFITRIAAELDATAKPSGGALVVQRRGEGLTAAGAVLPVPVIASTEFTEFTWDIDAREIYGSVEVPWSDAATGQGGLSVKGKGLPALRLRHAHRSKAEADRAAEARLTAAARAPMTLRASLSRFRDELLAGATVMLANFRRAELNGIWHLQTVQHRLDSGGLVTGFTAKKGVPT